MLKGKYISQQGNAKTFSVFIQTSLSASLDFEGLYMLTILDNILYSLQNIFFFFFFFLESHMSISLASSLLMRVKYSDFPQAVSQPVLDYWFSSCLIPFDKSFVPLELDSDMLENRMKNWSSGNCLLCLPWVLLHRCSSFLLYLTYQVVLTAFLFHWETFLRYVFHDLWRFCVNVVVSLSHC